jgi:hypothetical protein
MPIPGSIVEGGLLRHTGQIRARPVLNNNHSTALCPFYAAVLRRIRIRMFLGLPDPHPDPLARSTDPRIRIRIRIPTKMSRIRNTGLRIQSPAGNLACSGSLRSKNYGSTGTVFHQKMKRYGKKGQLILWRPKNFFKLQKDVTVFSKEYL